MKHTWLLRVAAAAVMAGLGAQPFRPTALLQGPAASAQPGPVEFGPYIQRQDGRPADPVNLVLLGNLDTAGTALRVAEVMRWLPVEGSAMAFSERGRVRWTEIQLGMPLRSGSRYHLRLAGVQSESPVWGRYTLGAVHRDDTVPCGHIGVAFDELRNLIAGAMERAGYTVTWLWLGNDGPVEHCDGSRNHGDGWAAVIDLRQR